MDELRQSEISMRLPQLLSDWYRRHARPLPWRGTTEPYPVWVSEIMLQQTRVEAVKLYYDRFMRALPTVRELAACPQDQLLRLWEGLGYYNRVRNMQSAARVIVEEYDGVFPETYEALLALPGFGPYTAGAVASICFGERVCAIDGNVLRVMARLRGDYTDVLSPAANKDVRQFLLGMMPEEEPGIFNSALMELGETVCLPKGSPACETCPASGLCCAYAKHLQDQLPVRIRKTRRKIEQKTILVIRMRGLTAVRKRPQTGLLAGMYELPSLPGYPDMDAVYQYLSDIGLQVTSLQPLPEAKHIFTHLEWQMRGFLAEVEAGGLSDEAGLIFIQPDDANRQYPIPGAFSAYFRWMGVEIGAAELKKEKNLR